MKLKTKIMAIVLAFVCLFSIVGVSAAWVYADGPIAPISQTLGVGLFQWVAGEDQGDQTKEEQQLAGELTGILNGDSDVVITIDGEDYTGKAAFDKLVDDRKGQAGWFSTMKEMAIDDPNAEGLKDLLGISDDTELSAIIYFINEAPGYELYTTRVDVNAFNDTNGNGKKDANEEFVISKESIDNENYYIYPVNKITFTNEKDPVLNPDGVWIQKDIIAGYSRAIWYYETPNLKYNGTNGREEIRSFDVTLWGTGEAASIEKKQAIGFDDGTLSSTEKTFTIQNDQESVTLWFGIETDAYGVLGFTAGSDDFMFRGNNCNVTVYQSNGTTRVSSSEDYRYTLSGNSTYYFKVEYTASGVPEDISFTASRP